MTSTLGGFGVPTAEMRVDLPLVAALIREQFPQYAGLPLEPVGEGWDNAMMRLGTELVVRLPRRTLAAGLVENEQRWLPLLAQRLPLPIPAPMHLGRPSERFPWPWSIAPWLPGRDAAHASLDVAEAERFGRFLAALHRPAPAEAPVNPVRGGALAIRAEATAERMQRLAATTELVQPGIRHVWQQALDAPPHPTRHWLHGDLHPLNILIREGRLAGVIDWGDINGGDIATDLAGLWMLFDQPQRERALTEYGAIAEATAARARGWAVLFGVAMADAGLVNSPRHLAVGAKTLRRIASER